MDDDTGFAELVAAHGRRLIQSAWLLTGDWHAAEDLVQTALEVTWKHRGSIENPAAQATYAQRVAVRTWLRWRRRRWASEVPTERLPESPGSSELDDAELRVAIQEALATLPRKQRAVIILRYFTDLSEQQTALVLGCAVGTVKSQTSKAMARLRNSADLTGLLRDGNRND